MSYLITMVGLTVSGCFMAPLAFVGPATSGFSTASLVQTGVTSGANYVVKKSTGKTISEHALDVLNHETLNQSYFPNIRNINSLIIPKSKPETN